MGVKLNKCLIPISLKYIEVIVYLYLQYFSQVVMSLMCTIKIDCIKY